MGRKVIALGILVPLCAATGALASAKRHRHHHRRALPDFKIASGSLTAANGMITGSFRVKNAGRHRAKKSQAVVLIAAGRTPTIVQIYAVRSLKAGGSEQEDVSEQVPAGVPAGTFAIRACAGYKHTVKEKSKRNDCRKVGAVTVSSGPGVPTGPASTVPTSPADLAPDAPALFADGRGQYGGQPGEDFTSGYWADAPPSYDPTNQTPTTLVVWLHGCYGQAKNDISDVSVKASANRNYIAIAPQGPDGAADPLPVCWNPAVDTAQVMTDIAQAETRFNINRRRVIIAGYSSGGDLAYRTIFYNADVFAGILAINTDPFRDTGSTEAQSLAAAAWKFNIVQIAHDSDDEYPLATVAASIQDLKAAGFPVTFSSLPGHHYDDTVCNPPGTQNCTGTTWDIQHSLLPHVDADGWLSPAPAQ